MGKCTDKMHGTELAFPSGQSAPMTHAGEIQWGELPGSYDWPEALRRLEAALAGGSEREVRAMRLPSQGGRRAVYRILVREAPAKEATS
jgi:hypothetical protein